MDDAAAVARCHVACWRETYKQSLSAQFLASQDFCEREVKWRRILSEAGASDHAVAVVAGEIVGFAGIRISPDTPPARDLDLSVLYLRSAHHGSGLGQALLDSVLGDRPASLWVAEDNQRARAFYSRNHFRPEGARIVAPELENLVVIRLVR